MKTPRWYSIVPIAPSKRTMRSGSTSRLRREFCVILSEAKDRLLTHRECGWLAALRRLTPHGVVLRLRVVHDDCGRALLRQELERARQLHPELTLGGEQPEDRGMIVEVRTR